MLIGNLGKDAETKNIPSGDAVTNFSIATSYRTKDKQSGEWTDHTDWHDVVLWKADKVAEYLTKGRQVYVEGRLRTRSWEDQNGQKRYRTEVVADKFSLMLLGGRDGQGGGQSAEPPHDSGQSAGAYAGSDDDVPF